MRDDLVAHVPGGMRRWRWRRKAGSAGATTESDDGANWQQENPAAPFAGRNAANLIHNGELYLIGGFGVSRQHTIWRSADGATWRLGFSNPIVAP